MGFEMRASEFMDKYGITVDVAYVTNAVDDGGWEHTEWSVTALYGAGMNTRVMTFPYRTGMGLTGGNHDHESSALYSYATDAHAGDLSFEEFADEFGYDQDSRKAYATWEACVAASSTAYEWCKSEAMREDLISLES